MKRRSKNLPLQKHIPNTERSENTEVISNREMCRCSELVPYCNALEPQDHCQREHSSAGCNLLCSQGRNNWNPQRTQTAAFCLRTLRSPKEELLPFFIACAVGALSCTEVMRAPYRFGNCDKRRRSFNTALLSPIVTWSL